MDKETTFNFETGQHSYKIAGDAIKEFEGDNTGIISQPVIEALCRGDQDAFQRVYLHTYDKLKEFLRYLLNSSEDAEEGVQDIFLYILENRDKIDPSKNFRGYLYTIAKNIAYKQIARRRNDDRYVSYKNSFAPDLALSPDELVMTDELALLITIYIDNMPPQRRRVFEMSRIEGKSIQEIADTMNLSPNTVKSHLQTATRKIKELFALFAFLFFW